MSTDPNDDVVSPSDDKVTQRLDVPPVKITVHSRPDLLQVLFDRQRQFMRLLGIPELMEHEEYLRHPVFEAAVDGLVTEAAEVLGAMSTLTKPWKQVPIEDTRRQVLEESVDLLFMLLEVFLVANLSPEDVMRLYDQKLIYNLDRLNRVSNNANPAVTAWALQLTRLQDAGWPPSPVTK